MATDPRLELARRMAMGQGGGAPVGGGAPMGSLQQEAAARFASLAATKKKKKAEEPGGWKGLVAAAFDNPVAKVALAPLTALDYGRSALVSTVQEIADSVDGNADTKGSFGDLFSQTKNHIGFGDIKQFKTNNKWLDRLIGFTGDVALDPLTWTTLGLGNLASAGGKIGLAANIAEKGAVKVAAKEITEQALENMLSRVGKNGLSKLTAAEREAFGLAKPGLYFGRPFAKEAGKGVLIPGTTKVGEKLASGLGSVKNSILGSKPVTKLLVDSKTGFLRSAPEGLEEALTKLATGKGKITATQAAAFVSSHSKKAALAGAFTNAWSRQADNILNEVSKDEAARVALTHAAEAGDVSNSVVAATRKWFDDVRSAYLTETGKTSDAIGYRDNYMPHVWGDEGRAVLAGETEVAQDLRKAMKITVDEVKKAGPTFERKIEAGTYKIAGKDVTFNTGTINEINTVLAREFPDVFKQGKALEEDALKLMGHYANAMGTAVGDDAFVKRITALGVGKTASDAMHLVKDVGETKAANKVLAEELVDEIKNTDVAIKKAKADAFTSMKAAVENVSNTLKVRLQNMTRRNFALEKQFDDLATKLADETLSFDARMMLLNDAELVAREQYDKAVSLTERLKGNYEAQIAATEQAGKQAEKGRVVAMRNAKQAIAEAESDVQLLESQLQAYNDLKQTVASLNDSVKGITEGYTLKNIPEDARKAASQRTVAAQRAVDSAATAGADVTTKVVPLGSGMNESFGLMNKLNFDSEAVGSALRATVAQAGEHLGEAFDAEIAAVKNLVDAFAARTAQEVDPVLEKLTNQTIDMTRKLNSTKMKLELARKNSSAATVAKWEGRVRNLENAIGNIKTEYDAVVASNKATGIDLLRYDPNMPGDFAEQAQRQINDAKAGVLIRVERETLAKSGPVAAQKNAAVIDNLFKAMEVTARARRSPDGAASLVAAAQMTLEQSVKDARVAVDFGNRMKVVIESIEQSGRKLTPLEMTNVENLVMREVLATEKRGLQKKLGEVIDSIDHYASQEAKYVDTDALEKTTAFIKGTEEADRTWDVLKLYLDEIFAVREEAALRGSAIGSTDVMTNATEREIFGKTGEEFTNSGFSVYSGASAGRAQQEAFAQAERDLSDTIVNILFEGNKQAAKEYRDSGRLRVLLRKISNGYGPDAKAAWTEEIRNIYLSRSSRKITRGQRATEWLATAVKGAEKETEILREEILNIERVISRLRPSGAKVGSEANDATVAFFREQADAYRQRLRQLNAAGTRQGAEVDKIKNYIRMFSDAAEERATSGSPQVGPRLSAQEVLAGKTRPTGVPQANKQLQEARTQIIAAELEMEKMVSTGALKDAVKDIPGKKTIYNKAKDYLKVLDEELGILGERLARQTNEAGRKPIAKYIETLTAEKNRMTTLLRNAEPLEDRLASSKVVLQTKREALKALPRKSVLSAENAAKVEGLRTQMNAVAAGRTVAEAKQAAKVAEVEMTKESLRETFDATVVSTRDAMGTISDAREEINSLIPAIEQLVRETPKVPKGVDRTVLTDLTEWLADSYDLMDEQTLVERLFNMPGDMTPDMLKPGRNMAGISNPELVAYLRSLPADPSSNTALALIYKAHQDTGALLTLIDEKKALQMQLKMAKDRNLVTVMKRVAKDGMQELADSGIYVPQEVANMMQRLVEIDGKVAGELRMALNKYTEIWKAVKTTSPRFHIRNAMSATFMNYVAGVKSRNMMKGVDYWRMFENDPINWLNNIPAAERPYVKGALEDVFGSGGGQYSEVAMANTKLSNKGVFKWSKEKGVQVEGYVRMGMALDSRLPVSMGGKGLGADQSVARITKFHFNYSALSKLDREAKAFIPFWTFMSRNLPLQIEQMWMNPRVYAHYNSFVRNMNDEQEGDIVPKYIKEVGGFKLPFGTDLYATPDIGMNRVSQDIAQLRDPLRLGQNLNPLFKTPLEYWAGKQFYKDIPLSGDKYVPLQGLAGKALIPALGAFGGVERSSDGSPVASQKNYYAGMSLIPGLQELERLVNPGQESYKDKQGMSVLSFLTGAPVTKVTEAQKKAELERAKRDLAKSKAKKKAVEKAGRK